MWANRKRKEWDWSQEVGLQWIPEGKGMRYLGIQVGFHLPTEANFDKMMVALKSKLINWNTYCLSLAGKVLVSNQVLLASMWYLAACGNPNPRMCDQVWEVVRNFTWGGKASNARTKVKWDTLALPTTKGGHRSQDPIGSPTSKAFDQGPGPKGRTLEGALEAQG